MSKVLGGVSCGCICAGSANDNANASSNHEATNKKQAQQ